MKSNSVVAQSPRDTCNEIPILLKIFVVVMRAEVTKIVESCMAKTYDKGRDEVVETVSDPFDNAIQSNYSYSYEALRAKRYNIVEHAFKKSVRASQGSIFDKNAAEPSPRVGINCQTDRQIRFVEYNGYCTSGGYCPKSDGQGVWPSLNEEHGQNLDTDDAEEDGAWPLRVGPLREVKVFVCKLESRAS